MTLSTKQVRLASLIVDQDPSSDNYEEQIILKKLFNNEVNNEVFRSGKGSTIPRQELLDLISPSLTESEIEATLTYLKAMAMITEHGIDGDDTSVSYSLASEARQYIETYNQLFLA